MTRSVRVDARELTCVSRFFILLYKNGDECTTSGQQFLKVAKDPGQIRRQMTLIMPTAIAISTLWRICPGERWDRGRTTFPARCCSACLGWASRIHTRSRRCDIACMAGCPRRCTSFSACDMRSIQAQDGNEMCGSGPGCPKPFAADTMSTHASS